jgi:putative transposase
VGWRGAAIISDAHLGLQAAISAVLLGAAWQRRRVHFLRNVLAAVPKGSAEMVAAAIRTIFAQPKADMVRDQLGVIAGMLGRQFPKVEAMLRDANEELLAFTAFPPSHWKKIWSTNLLERLNKEVKRRTDVVGVLPNPEALLRLAGAVLVEAHDEWQTSDRRHLAEDSMALLTAPANEDTVAGTDCSRHDLTRRRAHTMSPGVPPLHGTQPKGGRAPQVSP